MSLLSRKPRRGKHTSRHIPVQTRPARPEHTAPITRVRLPAPRALDATAPFPAPEPYARPRRPRVGRGPRRGRPYLVTPSPVRDGVLLTGHARIAEGFRFGLPCLCGREHVNVNTGTFRELRMSAEDAGWQQDVYGIWRCPRCARRRETWFGVRPVAAIEAAA